MKRITKILALTLTAVALILSLASCDFIDTLLKRGGEIDYKAEIAKISFVGAEYTYDGEAKSLAISGTLPEGVSVSYEGNGKTEVGEYTVTAKFYLSGSYIEGADKTATLTILAAESGGDDGNVSDTAALLESLKGVSLSAGEFTYDGEAKSLGVTGDLPEGVTVRYRNNGKTNCGVYNVIAEFYYGNKHIVGADKSASLTIKKGVYDMSGISLESKTVTYDGEYHSLQISGTLPEGVTANYGSNSFKNAGTYDITVRFNTSDVYNYEPIAPMKATLTIEKASYDMTGITYSDARVEYDNKEHTIEISGALPEGVSVSYSGEYIYPGEYEIEASFSVADGANYNVPAPMKATLTIFLGENYVVDLSHITFEDATVAYNGKPHTHEVKGNIPYQVTVEYSYEGNLTDVGVYELTARFFFMGQELPNTALTSHLTVTKADIDMSNVEFNGKMVLYDGMTHTIEISGTLPEGVTVTYTGGEVSAPGVYEIVASFSVLNESCYNRPEDLVATLVIAADTQATPGIVFEGGEVVGYEGDARFVVIPREHNGVTVTSIKSGAFMNKDIEALYVPGSVTNIGNNAFRGCKSLNTVYLNSGVKVIGQYAFANTSIRNLVLPDSLEHVAIGALAGAQIYSLTIPFIGDARVSSSECLAAIFGAADYAGGKRVVPESLKEIIISNACTEIPEYAFFGLDTVENIVIGSSVKKIGNSAFYGCKGIKKIYIPESVEEMLAKKAPHNSAFYGCSEDLVVYVGAKNTAGFGMYWCMISDTEHAEVVWDVTPEEYANIQ